jgi:XapX domain-containing protein
MIAAIMGLLLGLVIGAGCRLFDIPPPAPPRLIGACLLLAMTVGFVAADHPLPPGKTIMDSNPPGRTNEQASRRVMVRELMTSPSCELKLMG